MGWLEEKLAEDAVTAVRRMKDEREAPIRTLGSISLGKSLIGAGLVDFLQVTVFPVVTGQTGLEPLYADWPDLDLDLVEARTLDGRMQVLRYVPTLH